MRASTACITSSGEAFRARYRGASAVAGVKQRSRSLTGGSGGAGRLREDLARVEGVAQAVAEVADAEHGQEDRGAGEQRPVRGEVEVVLGVEEDPAPRGDVGREAQPEERQRGLRDDGGGHV